MEGTTGLKPYEWFEDAQVYATSANTSVQLYRAPWPSGRYVEIVGARISNIGAASGGHVVMWDQDLSNTTPTAVGSAALPRAVFGYGAAVASGVGASTVEYGRDGTPNPPFYGGIAFQASTLNVHINLKLRIR
jgi:hypothetical protein